MSTHYVVTTHVPDSHSGFAWLLPGTPLTEAAAYAGAEAAAQGVDARVRLVKVRVPRRRVVQEYMEDLDADDLFDAMPALWESEAAKVSRSAA